MRILLLLLMLAAPARAATGFDLLFRDGALAGMAPGDSIAYAAQAQAAAAPDWPPAPYARLRLTMEAENMVRMTLEDGPGARMAGAFPASVGQPLIVFFMEMVTRDMAMLAGGSPFYIRNRIKDALRVEVSPVAGEAMLGGAALAAQSLTIRPFEDDPNAARMAGFEALEIAATMAEAAPGGYVALSAVVPGDGAEPLYRRSFTLEPTP